MPIRREFETKSTFSADFVDSLLRWANGLNGKMGKLLLPLAKGTANKAKLNALNTLAEEISNMRNAVAHQGEFSNENEAKECIEKTYEFIIGLVGLYNPSFHLKRHGRPSSRRNR